MSEVPLYLGLVALAVLVVAGLFGANDRMVYSTYAFMGFIAIGVGIAVWLLVDGVCRIWIS